MLFGFPCSGCSAVPCGRRCAGVVVAHKWRCYTKAKGALTRLSKPSVPWWKVKGLVLLEQLQAPPEFAGKTLVAFALGDRQRT